MPIKWVPHKYQKKAVDFLCKRSAAGLFLDPGLGKTSITLAAIEALRRKGKAHRWLIVSPLRVAYEVWPKERGKWAQFHGMPVNVYHGHHPKDMSVDGGMWDPIEVCVVNFDYIPKMLDYVRDNPQLFWDTFQFDGLIIDELSAFKSVSSKRFKRMKKMLGTFDYRWGLTGSPAANNIMNLFGEMYMLDMGESLGRYITHFRHKYFVPSGYQGYDWRIRDAQAEAEIYKAISSKVLRLSAEDYLDMPDLSINDISVTLPDKAYKAYKEVEKDFVTVLENDVLSAPNKAAAFNKCRQIASGAAYLDEVVKPVHSAKIDALQDLVDELQGSPLLVGVGFRFEVDLIREKLGKAIPVVYGGTTPKDAASYFDAWNRGELPVLLAHPASMAHGVNLQAGGCHLCWYTLPWDFEQYDQFNRRLYRQGSKAKRVTVHRILADKTIDTRVDKVLSGKGMTQNKMFNYLKGVL